MSIILGNTVLKAAEDQIEAQMSPQIKQDYLKIVVSGLKVALNGAGNSPFSKMVQTTKNPIRDCVDGAIALCLHMRAEAKGVMPMRAMIPAAMTLMIHALDLVDKAGLVKIGKPELAEATKLFMATIFKKFNITKDQLAAASGKTQALVQNPATLEKLHQAAGLKATPSPLTPAAAPTGGANGV